MFIVFLRFSSNKSKAPDFMDGHMVWLKKGFDDGVFFLAGSITPNAGGGILAVDDSLEAIHKRVEEDPFVKEGIVNPEVIEISPSKVDDRLKSLFS